MYTDIVANAAGKCKHKCWLVGAGSGRWLRQGRCQTSAASRGETSTVSITTPTPLSSTRRRVYRTPNSNHLPSHGWTERRAGEKLSKSAIDDEKPQRLCKKLEMSHHNSELNCGFKSRRQHEATQETGCCDRVNSKACRILNRSKFVEQQLCRRT